MSRASDALRPNRGCWHAISRDRALCACRECSKPDRSEIRPGDRADVLEERVSDNLPWLAAGSSEPEDGPGNLAARDLGQFKVVWRDGPCLAAERNWDVNGR
jgi:hypothetical protein